MPQYTVDNFKQDVEAAIKRICQELDADMATFHLYDQEADILYFPMSYGLYERAQFERGVPNMNRLPGHIARSKETTFIADIEASSGLAGPFSYTEGVKSVAGLPISHHLGLLGILFLNYRQTHFFPQQEQTRIIKAAAEFAKTINDLLEQVDLLLLQPGALPSSSRQTRQQILLQEIVNTVSESVKNASIVVWLPDGEHLVGKISADVEAVYMPQLSLKNTSQDPVVVSFKNKEALYIEDIGANKQYQLDDGLQSIQEALRWRTIILEPIKSQYGQILGVIAAYSRGFLNFNSIESSFLKALAASAAVRLESERKIDSLNALHDLGTRLTMPLSLHETLNEIVQAVPKILDADICTVHLYNAAKRDFEDVNTASTFGANPDHVEKPRTNGIAHRVIHQGWIVAENVETETFDAYSTFVREENVHAYVGINLQVYREPVGVMFISYRTPHHFTADEYTLMRAISYYAATAVYAARVLGQRDTFAEIAREITTA
ncbi:MAG: GAF domain-containing protein, partial [Anaerolineae bacterium]|nr:GAF domain-containing protein [Anaerolineae bacterium]